MTDSLWYKHAIFYEVSIRAFCDSNGDGKGDLPGLTSQLDYLRELGVDCLWLLPMYPSPLKDDGYDIADYYNIHPDFGTLDDFKTLLQAAHARGLRVITDLVLNHTSDQHAWFQAARADRNSPYRDYYVWRDTDTDYAEVRIIFRDVEKSNWTWDEQAGQYFWHRFYASQPDLNYDNPAVQEAMLQAARFWLDMGVDGFRVDAVTYLFEREGTNCESLPETHAYVKRLRRMMEEHYPDRILLAEANQWPQQLRDYFGQDDEFHMAFHFPVMPRIFLALAQGDVTPIVDILNATPTIPPRSQWAVFLRNHDELTLEMVNESERQAMYRAYAPDPRMILNLGLRRRLAPLLGRDPRRLLLAHALLLTLPGTPVLYYGDEIGLGDNLELPDRNGVRTPMHWDASPNAGFSAAPAEQLYAQPLPDYVRVNVATQRADLNSWWHTLRHLLALRKQHPLIGAAPCTASLAAHPAVLQLRFVAENSAFIGIFNFAPTAYTLTLSSPGQLITHAPATYLEGERLTLGGYGFAWLRLPHAEA